MTQLILASLFFVGIHFLLSGSTLRDTLTQTIGERTFQILFGLLSLLGIIWLIWAYSEADYIESWGELYTLRPVIVALMLLAFLFVIIGITTPNPTMLGREALLESSEPAIGILRITRHPLLWGVALWATAHLIINGDFASLIFFGTFLVLALGGTRFVDAKRRRRLGERWQHFVDITSNTPFVAILQKRNQLKLGELGVWRVTAALLAFALLLYFHLTLFGVSPLPI